MKVIALLSLLIISTAQAVEIKISSFLRTNRTNTADETAEVCALVKNAPNYPVHVTITSDPGRDPAHYFTLVPAPGNFCQIIRTRYGRVEVSIDKARTQSSKLL